MFENLDGGDDVIDRGAFGVALLDLAREENPSARITLDARRFTLVWKDQAREGEYRLDGLYRECLEAAPGTRGALMHNRAAHLSSVSPSECALRPRRTVRDARIPRCDDPD